MDRFIISIYNKFFQLLNFYVKQFLPFRIRKRSSFRKIQRLVYILVYHTDKWPLIIPLANGELVDKLQSEAFMLFFQV